MQALDILIEVFTWAGLGGAVLAGIVAVVLWAADGSWIAARGVVEEGADGLTVRWFDGDGEVNSAVLTEAETREVGDSTMIDLFYRHGWRGRMRLTARSTAVSSVVKLAIGLGVFGVVALVTGWVLLFVRG